MAALPLPEFPSLEGWQAKPDGVVPQGAYVVGGGVPDAPHTIYAIPQGVEGAAPYKTNIAPYANFYTPPQKK